jgi:hypothetical protein
MNKHAQTLGRMAKGHPKNFSKKETDRRRALMVEINKRRQLAKSEGQQSALK